MNRSFRLNQSQIGIRGTTAVVLLVVALVTLTAAACPGLAAPRVQQFVEYPFPILSYEETLDGPGGALEVAWLGFGANETGRLRLGTFSPESGGIGRNMHATAWMAAVVASNLLYEDLFDYSIYFDFPEPADGNSAGAAITVALLAAMLGDELSPDVAMTGAINPDGSIGPIAGIREKLHGAAAAGVSTVLLPRVHERSDIGDDEWFDHVAYGASLGIDVHYVGNVYEAYPFFTGASLPRFAELIDASAADVAAILTPTEGTALLEPTFDLLLGSFLRWDIYLDDLSLKVEDPDSWVSIELLQRQAWDTLSTGRIGVALDEIRDAAIMGDLIVHSLRIEQLLIEGDLVALLDYVQDTAESIFFLAELSELAEGATPEHAGQVASLLEFASGVANALGTWTAGSRAFYQLVGEYELLDENYPGLEALFDEGGLIPAGAWDAEWLAMLDEEDLEEIIGELMAVVLRYRLADWGGRRAADHGGWWLHSDAPAPDPNLVDRLSRQYRAAAIAVHDYLDSTMFEDIAEMTDMRVEAYRRLFMNQNWDYAFAHGAHSIVENGSIHSPWFLLGATGGIYNELAGLVTAYSSLYAYPDEDGSIVHIGDEEGLDELLDMAEMETVGAIVALRRLGVEPVQSLLYLEQARAYRHGDNDERIHALKLLWRAHSLAQTTLWTLWLSP